MRTISADMGGSRVKLAVVENGSVIESEMFPVAPDGFGGTLAELERRIASIRARHPWRMSISRHGRGRSCRFPAA